MAQTDAGPPEAVSEQLQQLTAEIGNVRTLLAGSASEVLAVLETLRESDAFLARMRSRAVDISEIIALLEHIASESRLLALNAKILAAQAGHAGDGFTIVAERMMALADHTRASAGDIMVRVEALKTETAQAAGGVSAGLKKVEAAVRLSDAASDALQTLFEAAKGVARALRRPTRPPTPPTVDDRRSRG